MALQVPRDGLEQKLQRLSQSQQSIESVSSFCIFYHKDARGVVSVWDQQFYKAPTDRKIALLYLANHILQEGRKKSTGFQEEFFKVLPDCIRFLAKNGDDKVKRVITRLVNVWEERHVFGTRHIKSFKEVLGVPTTEAKQAAAATTTAVNSASAAKLGPVADVLSTVATRAAESAAKGQEFTASWSQGVLTTAGLADVTACHSRLSLYSAALQDELTARQTALTALNAELARQNAEVGRLQSQLSAVGNQKAQLDQRLLLLTNQMSSAMASLGQMFQQNGGAAAAPAGAGTADTPVAAVISNTEPDGSPQAPDLELDLDDDDDDDDTDDPRRNGTATQSMQQQQPLVSHDLQALLQNPQLLSAAITGSIAGGAVSAAAAAASVPQSGAMLQIPVGGADGGMQLQLETGAALGSYTAAAGNSRMLNAAAAAGSWGADGVAVGVDSMGGQMQLGGFGGLAAAADLNQQPLGFADEADDPYDPEHPD